MVLERAARLAAEAPDVPAEQTGRENGMRLAVSYLNGEASDLLQLLQQQPPQQHMDIRSGMATTLLRNIILPRGGTLSELTILSLKGIRDLSGSAADIISICGELQQILEQYSDHKKQVKQQFDESIINQLKMGLQQQGVAVDEKQPLNPAMHPKYQEEWTRVSSGLNDQYNQALDQRKKLISERFTR